MLKFLSLSSLAPPDNVQFVEIFNRSSRLRDIFVSELLFVREDAHLIINEPGSEADLVRVKRETRGLANF